MRRVAVAAAGIDEMPFEVYPVQEHMPGGAYAAGHKMNCKFWLFLRIGSDRRLSFFFSFAEQEHERKREREREREHK